MSMRQGGEWEIWTGDRTDHIMVDVGDNKGGMNMHVVWCVEMNCREADKCSNQKWANDMR